MLIHRTSGGRDPEGIASEPQPSRAEGSSVGAGAPSGSRAPTVDADTLAAVAYVLGVYVPAVIAAAVIAVSLGILVLR